MMSGVQFQAPSESDVSRDHRTSPRYFQHLWKISFVLLCHPTSMKKSLLKWFRKRKDILDHNLNTVYSLPCDCSYCSKTLIGPSDSDGWAISGMSRQNSARDSGKKRQASPLTNRPEKKHEGFFERPSLLSQMASRDPNVWPLPGNGRSYPRTL